jgi:anti-sigma factor RsiW
LKCEDSQKLLHGYVDGELDLIRSLTIEEHLRVCSACAEAHRHLQDLQQQIRSAALYERAPLELHERIRASFLQGGPADRIGQADQAGRVVKSWMAYRELSWRWFSIAASFLLIALLGWNIFRPTSGTSAEDVLAEAVISRHVQSLMAHHLVDVESSDQHTVKPWFSGQLDFSPTVKDLANEGFPLAGGRLDYLNNRATAALVYKRHKHNINLFVWPTAVDTDEAMHTLTRQGYHVIHWTIGGFAYWAISDLNEQELQEFVRLIQQK